MLFMAYAHSCRTIHNIGELWQQSVFVQVAWIGIILPTSPGGADSMNEATISSLDPMFVDCKVCTVAVIRDQ